MADNFRFDREDLQKYQFRQDVGSGKKHPLSNQASLPEMSYQLQHFGPPEGNGLGSKAKGGSFRISKPASPRLPPRRPENQEDYGPTATRQQQQVTFLDRFRSRAASSPKHYYMRSQSSRSVLTSPVDNSAATSAPYSSSPGSDVFFGNPRNGSSASLSSGCRNSSKTRKWYSFTSLLSRSNLKEILTLPRSRLSVSSIFTTSDGELTPTEPKAGSRGLPKYFEESSSHQPASPTPSCVTISGEFPSRPGYATGAGTVVYRKPRYGQRSVSASAASGVTFNNNTSYSSVPGVGPEDRSSSCRGTSAQSQASKSGNRLSCGEFFPGPAPSSPGFLGPDFQFHFYNSSRNTHGGSGNRGGENVVNGNGRRALGRSLPTLLEAMESPSNLNGNSGSSDETSTGPVTVESVAELLYQEYAILTGSKTLDDHYILIFPDRGNFHQLGDEDYRRLMKYLTSVPPMQDAESGFVIIVDRRSDKWNSVKTLLVRVSCYFPGLIHRVFILRPAGFLQKALSEVSSKLFRTENLRFRLTVCNHVSDLLSFVDPGQLPTQLGGLLMYDKVQWVQQRVEVEAFHLALQTLSRDLKSFTESFVDLEYPNDVGSTEKLIQLKTDEFSLLKSDLTQAGDHGESILRRIKGFGAPNGANGSTEPRKPPMNSVHLVNVILVERFILQIDETGRLFQEFWEKELHGLERCLRLRRFEQEFRELRASFDTNVKSLNGIPEMGETLALTETLILDTVNFQELTKGDLKRASELEVVGREIVSSNPASIDTVEPKCIELSRMVSHFRFIVQEKVTKQKQWREVQGTIENANILSTEGMDLLSTQKMIESTEESPDWTKMKSEVDMFVIKLENKAEELMTLKGSLGNVYESKTLVKQVLRRIEEAQNLFLKRQAFLLLQVEKKSSSFFKTRRSSGNIFQSTDKASKLYGEGDGSSVDGSFCSSMTRSSFSSTHSSDGVSSNGKVGDEEKDKGIKRFHVLQELLQTEQTYVDEIGLVLTGYRGQATNPEIRALLPSQLTHDYDSSKVGSNVGVLFCNLDEIHAFHSKIFLPDLSTCIQSIELVALCFIQRHSDFLAMYSQYCQLKAASDTLLKEIGDTNPWLLACQEKLGHRLPLSSYLLKPVQRITKYHLILGSLLKHSDMCDGYSELTEALDCMVVVVRSVNDGMHQLHIRGYPAKLSAEGPLLLQGSFTVWIETAKNRLRLKGHQRYLFLYQKSILVCKKTGQQSSLTYEFKNKINLSEVGITEDPKGSGALKKFEIWIQGRQKVFVLQASSREVKVEWVKEVKRLLMEQLHFLREAKNASVSSSTSTGYANPASSSLANAGLKRGKMIQKGSTLNGWRTPGAGHRPLRQVSSYETTDSGSSGRPKSRSTESDFEEEHWSTEASNSEDEESLSHILPMPGRGDPASSSKLLAKSGSGTVSMYGVGENIENGPKFVVSNDYVPGDSSCEIPLKKSELVVLVKTGCAGWWFVRTTGPDPREGWAPSGFLERQTHPSLTSISSSVSSQSVGVTLETPSPLHKQSSVPCLAGMNYSSNYSGAPNLEKGMTDFHYEASVIRKMCSELSSDSESRLRDTGIGNSDLR